MVLFLLHIFHTQAYGSIQLLLPLGKVDKNTFDGVQKIKHLTLQRRVYVSWKCVRWGH